MIDLTQFLRLNIDRCLIGVLTLMAGVFAMTSFTAATSVFAAQTSDGSQLSDGGINIQVVSPSQIRGIAGQIVKIEANISNLAKSTDSSGGITYISIVDLKDKVPIDLEDWSAEKGLYIPSIAPGQSLPLEWNVRLVKAGSYTVDILFNRDSDLSSAPVSSSKILMDVQPKFNLNPENILPVAFGVPAALLAVLGSISYHRGRKTGIYG